MESRPESSLGKVASKGSLWKGMRKKEKEGSRCEASGYSVLWEKGSFAKEFVHDRSASCAL
jgi:hypothetical protein